MRVLLVIILFCLCLGSYSSCTPAPSSCLTDRDCLGNEECAGGLCRDKATPECTTNSDCSFGTECYSGSCRAISSGCVSNSDCATGQVCEGSKCKEQKSKASEGQACSVSGDCASGLVCVTPLQQNSYACRRRCGKSSDCPSSQYCYDIQGGGASCQNDIGPPRDYRYRVRIISGQVTEKGPDGSAWDAFGGLPDLKVKIFIGGSTLETSEASDSTTANWNYTTSQSFSANDIVNMKVGLYDVDVASDDVIILGEGFKVEKAKLNSYEFENSRLGVVSLKVEVIGSSE